MNPVVACSDCSWVTEGSAGWGHGGGAIIPYNCMQVAGMVLAASWAAKGGHFGGEAHVATEMHARHMQKRHGLSLFFFLFSSLVTAAGVMQGRMLSQLGVAWCLTAGPLVAACLMAATAVYPNTYMIGIGEIIRKVNTFTDVTRVTIPVDCLGNSLRT